MGPRWIWLTLLLDVLLAGPLPADGPADELSYSQRAVFRIPFQTDPNEHRLRAVELWVSTDQGRSWHHYANVPPERGYFEFTAERDGVFWFTVRTLDLEGRAYPPGMEGARPGLKVCVDTQPPSIDLRALPSRDGQLGVAWEVQDANLDLAGFGLESRLPGAADWRPLYVQPAARGTYYWKPETNGSVEVRLRTRDLAKNQAEKIILLSSRPEDRYADDGPQQAPAPPTTDPRLRMVNSKRINISYEVKDKGPSGVSVVELWYTFDGRNWQKYGEKNDSPPYVVDVSDEGRYGFTLVARSGVGLGERPPQVGDQPQVWVVVDVTAPQVRLHGVEVGRGTDAGKLTILYTATDKHLGRQPITLSYAEKPAGPWQPIDTNLENTGRYVWQMPKGAPWRLFVRVEAADLAGNVGTDQTREPVLVDLSQPKSVIVDITAGR